MIVRRDEQRQPHQRPCQHGGEQWPAGVGEGRVSHEAGGVDHGELVDELHWVFERGMEEEASCAHEQVANERNNEDCFMVLLQAGSNSAESEVDEKEVGKGIDDLCSVDAGVVVLRAREAVSEVFEVARGVCCLLLHTSSGLRSRAPNTLAGSRDRRRWMATRLAYWAIVLRVLNESEEW